MRTLRPDLSICDKQIPKLNPEVVVLAVRPRPSEGADVVAAPNERVGAAAVPKLKPPVVLGAPKVRPVEAVVAVPPREKPINNELSVSLINYH